MADGRPVRAQIRELLIIWHARVTPNDPLRVTWLGHDRCGRSITVRAGAAFTVAIPGSDPDGDAITWKMTGAPTGLTLGSSGVLSWSKAVKGVYTLKITVTDSKGLAGAVGTITLNVTA